MTIAPKPALIFTITAHCEQPVEMGRIDGGAGRMIPILGGPVAGDRLNGTVMPGADWAIMREGGVATVEARYAIRAEDGTIIQVFNGVTDQLGTDPQNPTRLITSPRFLAPEGPHDWLNHGVYVGVLIPNISETSFSVTVSIYKMA